MRIVSLVPSLTETAFALGSESVIGRTAWCVHPAPRVDGIPKLGGTKTPDVERVIGLQPDVVLLDEQENRREDHDRLVAAGVPVFVTNVTSLADVPAMLKALGATIDRTAAGAESAAALEAAIARMTMPERRPRAVPLIWNEPLMSVAPTRYAGDLLVRCGFDVPDLDPASGYPEVSPSLLGEAGVEVLLLTSEPHDFTVEEGEAIADAVAGAGYPRPRPLKVDGEALTWFGARTLSALSVWTDLLNSIFLER